MKKSVSKWFIGAGLLALGVAIGSALAYRRCSQDAAEFAILDASSKIRLHVNLLRQIETGDVGGATLAHRQLIDNGLAAIDVLTSNNPELARSPDIQAARDLAQEVKTGRDSIEVPATR